MDIQKTVIESTFNEMVIEKINKRLDELQSLLSSSELGYEMIEYCSEIATLEEELKKLTST